MHTNKWLGVACALALVGCGAEGGQSSDDGSALGDGQVQPSAAGDARPLEVGGRMVEGSWLTREDAPTFIDRGVDPGDMVPISMDEMRDQIAQAEIEHAPNPEGLKAGHLFLNGYNSAGKIEGQVIANTAQYICFLSGVYGIYRGSTWPRVVVGSNIDSTGNTNITISKSNAAGAYVTCVSRSSFTSPGGFLPFQHNQYEYNFIWEQHEEWGCLPVRRTWGNGLGPEHVTMVAGFGYDFNHGGDRFITEQSGTLGVASTAWLEQTSAPCRAVGYTNAVSMRSSGLTRFRGPNGIGSITAAGEWARSIQSGTFTIDTGIPSASHTCYLGGIAGNFGSDNDLVALLPTGSTWRFFLSAVNPGGVSGRYRCVTNTQ
jgi:hypothetical protein